MFALLAKGPADWVAIHSLDLAPWNSNRRTEIDFVVIAPELGIMCIEVKSHGTIEFYDDRWHPESIKRSPFKQAADARHAFHRALTKLAPAYARIPIVHCCIFPNATFDLQDNLSVTQHELIDMRRFRSFRTGNDFCADLVSRMRESTSSDPQLKRLEEKLDAATVDDIVRRCVPAQKRRVGQREEIERREFAMMQILRDQQQPVLQLTQLNQRVVVSGGAGTGKTLIAMEVARRAADSGRRVALVCFNQLVGERMKRELAGYSPLLVVDRAIKLMAMLAGVAIPAKPTPQFWDQTLPSEIENKLTDPTLRLNAVFDYLVVDEAQDLAARPRLWDCLMQFLTGGADTGSFALFGDFENQVLHDRGQVQETLAWLQAHGPVAHWHLGENCRNFRIVAETAVRLSGFDRAIYSDYLRGVGSISNYDIRFYGDWDTQRELLRNLLRRLKGEGYRPHEIAVLSFSAADQSAAESISAEGFSLRPAWQGMGTGYTSVSSFKGMESKVVIITDVRLGDVTASRELFYVGMTRATESVFVLAEDSSRSILSAWIAGTR